MIFNRREALKALATFPVWKGATAAKAVEIGDDPTTKHYILFFDREVLDAEMLTERNYEGLLPKNATVILIGLHLTRGRSIDDVIKLYEVPDGV